MKDIRGFPIQFNVTVHYDSSVKTPYNRYTWVSNLNFTDAIPLIIYDLQVFHGTLGTTN